MYGTQKNNQLLVTVLDKASDKWVTASGRSTYTNLKWATKRALTLSKRRQDFARVECGGQVLFQVYQPVLFAA